MASCLFSRKIGFDIINPGRGVGYRDQQKSPAWHQDTIHIPVLTAGKKGDVFRGWLGNLLVNNTVLILLRIAMIMAMKKDTCMVFHHQCMHRLAPSRAVTVKSPG